ncbi:hypothetical protein ACLBOM_04990 [Escherichia coli]
MMLRCSSAFPAPVKLLFSMSDVAASATMQHGPGNYDGVFNFEVAAARKQPSKLSKRSGT